MLMLQMNLMQWTFKSLFLIKFQAFLYPLSQAMVIAMITLVNLDTKAGPVIGASLSFQYSQLVSLRMEGKHTPFYVKSCPQLNRCTTSPTFILYQLNEKKNSLQSGTITPFTLSIAIFEKGACQQSASFPQAALFL